MPKKKDYIPGTPPGSQGPRFENFDTAYEVDQIQKMAMESDRANLADINKQIAAADKELARLAGRVSPAQGRSAQSVAKSANYESKVIDTKRFLESEKKAITKILQEKEASLPQSYSSAVEEKNIAKKTIAKKTTEAPSQKIKQAPVVQGPKYSVKFDVMEAVTMGLEPAPPSEPVKPRPTPIGKITANKETGKLNYPEMKIGTTVNAKGERVPIKGTGPAREYLSERMLKSDADIAIEHEKVGADYQEKVIQEQIKMEKLEFDFDEGVTRSVSGDEFERVSTQEMFTRSSGTKDRVVVPANEANKAADIRAGMSIGDRAKYDAKIARDKAIKDKVKARQALQDAEIRKRGNRQLTGTGVKTFEVSSKGSDLGKQFSALNATFKTGPYAGKTIEQVWQSDIKKSGKGQRPGVGSILREGDIAQSKAEYQKLWSEWAKQNPSKMKELESVVKRGYVLTDSFAGDPSKTVNQAEALTNLTKSVKPNTMLGTPFKVTPPKSKIKDKPKSSGSFEIPSAVKAAAAAKVAKAMKNLGGKTNVLNIPIMTKGSADKIFKDFFGKQDYSS